MLYLQFVLYMVIADVRGYSLLQAEKILDIKSQVNTAQHSLELARWKRPLNRYIFGLSRCMLT